MYATPNFRSSRSLAPVNTVNPGWLRAPGENVSTYALETAIDELAYAVGVDPLEIRLRNYADHDQQAKLPWSTRGLREAYRAGAEAFGWEKRTLSRARCGKGRTDRPGHGLGRLPTPSAAVRAMQA